MVISNAFLHSETVIDVDKLLKSKGFLCGVILSIDSFSSIDVGFSMIEALKGQFYYLALET